MPSIALNHFSMSNIRFTETTTEVHFLDEEKVNEKQVGICKNNYCRMKQEGKMSNRLSNDQLCIYDNLCQHNVYINQVIKYNLWLKVLDFYFHGKRYYTIKGTNDFVYHDRVINGINGIDTNGD